MEYKTEEKERFLKHTLAATNQWIEGLDPTKLVNIEFFKSIGVWDEEISKKYDEVVKKWEKIKEITEQDKMKHYSIISDE